MEDQYPQNFPNHVSPDPDSPTSFSGLIHLQHALNNGMFGPTYCWPQFDMNMPAPLAALQQNLLLPVKRTSCAHQQEPEERFPQKLDVHVPHGGNNKDEQSVLRILTFAIDNINPEDLSRVCANMGVEQARAKTAEHFKSAFEALGHVSDSKRHRWPVFMEVANLECLLAPTKPAPKPSKTAIPLEILCKVKENLNVRVGVGKVGYWAHEIHLGHVDPDCLHCPDNLQLNKLPKSQSLHSWKTSAADFHVYLDPAAFNACIVNLANPNCIAAVTEGSHKQKHSATPNSNDDSDNEPILVADARRNCMQRSLLTISRNTAGPWKSTGFATGTWFSTFHLSSISANEADGAEGEEGKESKQEAHKAEKEN
ncbi:hypothetical protein BC835DRAFT_1421251 [Cytidiella melzeri]|nr:hypothetical protein BC835DRAFT_1421251 [Cytidiella melzeri]